MTALILYLCWAAIGAIITMMLCVGKYGKSYQAFCFGTRTRPDTFSVFESLRSSLGTALCVLFWPFAVTVFFMKSVRNEDCSR